VNPFLFGPESERLFGLYLPPKAGAEKRMGIVLCPPIHQEFLRSRWSLRQVSTQLTRAGLHVLRFDWYGFGDSGGEPTDGTPERWIEDIRLACKELKEISGVSTISLVGMRSGATLAAHAAASGLEIKDLVLLDPVVSGSDYLEGLRGLHRRRWEAFPYPRTSIREEQREEILGFMYNRAQVQAIGGLDLPATPPAVTGGIHWIRTQSAAPVAPPSGWIERVRLSDLQDAAGWDRLESIQEALVAGQIPPAVLNALGVKAV
jgi:pimeloyl-ACP methyl ester carboxylesterase